MLSELGAFFGRNGGIIRTLVVRQIREKYLNSGAGLLWALLVPLAQLAIYAFVFIEIFRVRFPGMDSSGYIAFVAVVMWPWNAFSESIVRAATSVTDHRDLIGKISVPYELLPLTTVTATFLVNLVGFGAVLIILALFGQPIALPGLPGTVVVLALLYVLTVALAFFVAATNVYIRDLAHLLPPLFMLWYFTTPILYPLSFVPERFQGALTLNPMTAYAERLRAFLLDGELLPGGSELLMASGALLALILCVQYFRRLSRQFEDYL